MQADVEKPANVATRSSSQQVLNVLGAAIPEMLGGSADLTGSNNTNHKGRNRSGTREGGNYIHYGVREFGMAAIMNGIALHGGFVPYGGTFLVFSDYARNAVRMSALMRQRVIYVFTHDSIGLGEDGPTHQPIEHVASLRLIPNLRLWRPCDTVETAVAWADAITHTTGPTALVLTRQALAPATRSTAQVRPSSAAATCWSTPTARRECVLIATGSEVPLAIEAAKLLAEKGTRARVVSMPCTSLFDAQDAAYRASVLPAGVPQARDRGRRARRLVSLRRHRRRRGRHGYVRRFGAGEEAVRALRLHRVERRGGGGGPARAAALANDFEHH